MQGSHEDGDLLVLVDGVSQLRSSRRRFGGEAALRGATDPGRSSSTLRRSSPRQSPSSSRRTLLVRRTSEALYDCTIRSQ
jgi:hypothetical protein